MSLSRTAGIVFPHRERRAVVLCGGPDPSPALVTDWLANADLLLCTDGAGRPYGRLPRPPDAVVGDFDSLPPAAARDGIRYVHDPGQQTSDGEKALLYAADVGCHEAVLLGAVGGRFDHGWYNGDLLLRLLPRLRVALADGSALTVPLPPGTRVAWDLPAGTAFSLLPQSGPAVVTVTGALYPLHDAELAPGRRASLSNRVVASPLRIEVGGGGVLASIVTTVPDGAA